MINIAIRITIYSDYSKVKQAVQMLTKYGMPIKALSVVGREMNMPENFPEFSDSPKCAGMWGERLVCVGGTAVLGNFGAFVTAAGETLAEGPDSGAIEVALARLGVRQERAKFYREQMHAGRFLLIVRTACNRHGALDVSWHETNVSTADSTEDHKSEWNSTVRTTADIAFPEFRRAMRPVLHVAHR